MLLLPACYFYGFLVSLFFNFYFLQLIPSYFDRLWLISSWSVTLKLRVKSTIKQRLLSWSGKLKWNEMWLNQTLNSSESAGKLNFFQCLAHYEQERSVGQQAPRLPRTPAAPSCCHRTRGRQQFWIAITTVGLRPLRKPVRSGLHHGSFNSHQPALGTAAGLD